MNNKVIKRLEAVCGLQTFQNLQSLRDALSRLFQALRPFVPIALIAIIAVDCLDSSKTWSSELSSGVFDLLQCQRVVCWAFGFVSRATASRSVIEHKYNPNFPLTWLSVCFVYLDNIIFQHL